MTIRGYGGDSLDHERDHEDVMSIANFVVLNRYLQRRNQKIPIAPCDSLLTLLTRLDMYCQYTYLNGPRACPSAMTLLHRFSVLPHASIFFSLPRIKGNSSGGNRVSLRSPRFCFKRSRDRDSLCIASHFGTFLFRDGSRPSLFRSQRHQPAGSRPCYLGPGAAYPWHPRALAPSGSRFAAVRRGWHRREGHVRRHSREAQINRHVSRTELRQILQYSADARRRCHGLR